jgi:hypothetical protein
MKLTDARIGYDPYSPACDLPGDRRRFAFYARTRELRFDVVGEASRDHDLVVVSATADITSWARADPSVKIVYDLVDSYLALPRWAPASLGRGIMKRVSGETRRLAWDYRGAIEAMCRRADAVVCTTEEQRAAIGACCPNVHIVLDHHGPEARLRKQDYDAHRPFRLVWEGLPYTLPAFAELRGPLERVGRRHEIELHLVTDLEFRRYARRFGRWRTADFAGRYVEGAQLHEWNVDTLAERVTSCDLAVIPALLDDPMFAGKPENKLLLFWRMAMPALVSATPAYRRAMNAAGLDMTAAGEEDWERLLERFIADPEARADAGRRGAHFTDEQHSDARLLERWDAVFRSVGMDPA